MHDIQEIKQAASGRWKEIISSLAGVDSAIFDGKHRPCPKCGGTDRFRAFDDFDQTGGCICNQCHNVDNGDGLATISWLRGGMPVGGVIRDIAVHLGIQNKKQGKSIEDGLQKQPWSEDLVQHYLRAKEGVTDRSLRLAGGWLARYRKSDTVIVLPMFGQDLAKPVNYILQNAMGGPLMVRSKGEMEPVGKKAVGKSKGLLGFNIERLKAGTIERVWKVEGVSDMLALVGAMTDEDLQTAAVVTSGFGAMEKPGWMADILAKYDCCIVGDLDDPGQAGAAKWAREISVRRDAGCTIVRLPGEVTRTHGKDLRSWLNEGNSYSVLLQLVKDGEKVVAKRNEEGDLVRDENADIAHEQMICRAIQIEVLGEKDNRKILIHSLFHRKTEEVSNIGRMTYEELLQICGPPAKLRVTTAPEVAQQSDTIFLFKDVKEAIAQIAGYRKVSDHDVVGTGIWSGRDLADHETGSIVLACPKLTARYNGDQVLRKVYAPRVDGLLIDAEGDRPWFDFDQLASCLQACKENPEFARQAVREATEIFSRWRWQSSVSPMLMTGCVLASYIQTVFRWRPQVSISGESNSGKSYLFECLAGNEDAGERGLFLGLAFLSSKSTEAGIRQTVSKSGQVVMLDEFEETGERDKILELIRTSSRGSKTTRGSAGQKSSKTGLRHIVWITAIETGLVSQPDRNRFIEFGLLAAEKEKQGQLRLPSPAERSDLGHRLLAVAIHFAHKARELAGEMRGIRVPSIDARQVENYAVPAAMISLANGYGPSDQESLLKAMLDNNIDKQEQGVTDQGTLLDDILSAKIYTGPSHGQLSVGQILDSQGHYGSYASMLESNGLRVTEDSKLFVVHRIVLSGLLRDTTWRGRDIRKILMRLPGAEARQLRLGGAQRRGITVDVDCWATTGNNDAGDGSLGDVEYE